MPPSILFLAGAALGATSLLLKPLPPRVIALLLAFACFAMGGVEIGRHNAEYAVQKAAEEERKKAASEKTREPSP